MFITIDGCGYAVDPGVNYIEILNSMCHPGADEALGIAVKGRTLSLNTFPEPGVQARVLTYRDTEGRRIYERSLRFIFLLAVHNLYPETRVRIENSAGRGIFANFCGAEIGEDGVRAIREEMLRLVAADLSFEKKYASREEAMAMYRAQGRLDKVNLLNYRPYEHFLFFSCGGMSEYFYGEMVPSTRYVPVFDVKKYLSGVMLMLPERNDASRAAAFVDQPQLSKTFAQSAAWGKILRCQNIGDLNDMIDKRGLREFIRVNEALHEKSIGDIADQIKESGARLILIAGPSSSGKTTFAHRLRIALRVKGLCPVKLSLDDYYNDRDKIALDEFGEADLENIDALDVGLFNKHLVSLLNGEEIETPFFSFEDGRRMSGGKRVRIGREQPILVEGIHALNDKMTRDVLKDEKFMIYVSALTTLNLDDHNRIRTTDSRMLRRIVRDYMFRGTSPEKTLSMWSSVRRGEEKYIFPYQERADVMFNSTLLYEMAVLKRYAYPMLKKITADSPHYTLARRLCKVLNYVLDVEIEDEIPVNSILREFIGGCCFYREED